MTVTFAFGFPEHAVGFRDAGEELQGRVVGRAGGRGLRGATEADTAITTYEDGRGEAGQAAEGHEAAATRLRVGLGTLGGLAGSLALGPQLALESHTRGLRSFRRGIALLVVGCTLGVGLRTYASAGGARSRVKRAKRAKEGSAARDEAATDGFGERDEARGLGRSEQRAPRAAGGP